MRSGWGAIIGLALAAMLTACATPPPAPVPTPPAAAQKRAFVQVGLASWYGPGFARKRTADGERFDADALTAAHRTLPIGARVRVTDLASGRSVVVRINDRGPAVRGRIIDLSARAARALGMKDGGLARVRIELVSEGEAAL